MERKIVISIPCMSTLPTAFVQSLLHLKPVGQTAINFAESSLVYESRDDLVKQALKMDADYIMWIDSDMVFQPDMLQKLIESDKDIITGVAFSRRPPYRPCIFEELEYGLPEQRIEKKYEEIPQGIFEIKGCGCACLLVKTKVYTDIINKFRRVHVPLDCYGEDVSFCIRAREVGYKIYCNADVRVDHISTLMVNEDTYKAYKEILKDGNDR